MTTPALPAWITPRSRWGARLPLGPLMPPRAALRAWLHHSVTRSTSDPLADMRAVEDIGAERFGRFSYSWAIHPSGLALEGAGFTIGAHTAGQNSTSAGLVLLGNYEDQPMTDAQVATVVAILRWLQSVGRLELDAPIAGHRDQKPTACPGATAYRRLPEIRRLLAGPPPPPPGDDPMMSPEQFAAVFELSCRQFGYVKARALHGLTPPERKALAASAGREAETVRKLAPK